MWLKARSFRVVLERSSNLFLRENSWSFLLCWSLESSDFRVWFSSLSLLSSNRRHFSWFSVDLRWVSFVKVSCLDRFCVWICCMSFLMVSF